MPTLRFDEPEVVAGDVTAGGFRAHSSDALPATDLSPTLDHLLVEAAIGCPEADALIGDFGTMTYADLLIRAQNVAVVLKRRGIGPGSFVGIAMEQSPVMVTAIVATILTGAAYAPLGPYLLNASAMRVLRANKVDLVLCDGSLTGGSVFERWQELGTVLDVSRMEQETMPSSGETRMLSIAPTAPAALLVDVASGQTNRERATTSIVISHRSIARLTASGTVFASGADETVLLPASIRARTGLFELWTGLLRGATIAVAPAALTDAAVFAEWVIRKGVNVLCLPVSRVHELTDQTPEVFAHLRHLIIESDEESGGVSPGRLQRLQKESPQLRIVHAFQGRRTAGYATVFRVPQGYPFQSALPIGRPVDGSRAYVLDTQQQPVRPGEIGELAFAGDCVAVPLPAEGEDSAAQSSESLSFTGERARLRADGFLELHGHAEPQLVSASVSRNVQAADVEAILNGQHKVREAAVIRDGKQQLVAFVAMEKEADSRRETERLGTREQLEASLRSSLPAEAVPSAVRYVDDLPYDAHGDVDRQELQQRWKKENERSRDTERLQQDTLAFVRALWLRLLRKSSIGYEEDFFEAGGTQVQMIRMHAELNRRFPGAISMGQLSVLRTIHGIYRHLTMHAESDGTGWKQRGA